MKNISTHFPKDFFKSPFSKGGFREIIKGLIIIPPIPLPEKAFFQRRSHIMMAS
jgi:hypothetical protein